VETFKPKLLEFSNQQKTEGSTIISEEIPLAEEFYRAQPDFVLAALGVKKRYLPWRLSDFQEIGSIPDILQGLFITGGPGTGKTSLASALFRDFLPYTIVPEHIDPRFKCDGAFSAIFIRVPWLFREIRAASQEKGARGETTCIERYGRIRLAVFDDFGMEKQSEWTVSTFADILEEREGEMLPTIVTSNLTVKEIWQVEPRVASRLAGMRILKLEGPDRRLGRCSSS